MKRFSKIYISIAILFLATCLNTIDSYADTVLITEIEEGTVLEPGTVISNDTGGLAYVAWGYYYPNDWYINATGSAPVAYVTNNGKPNGGIFTVGVSSVTIVANSFYIAPVIPEAPKEEAPEEINYVAIAEAQLDGVIQALETAIPEMPETETGSVQSQETVTETPTVECDLFDAIPISIMQKLYDSPKVDFVLKFELNGVKHVVKIPAGEAYVDPDITWYGGEWLLKRYGEYNPDSTPSSSSYEVQEGDNLGVIAAANGMALEELLAKNPQYENPDLIFPGDKLNL